jgi:hypothetical protein
MKTILLWLTFGHHLNCTVRSFAVVFLIYLGLIAQIFGAYYAWKVGRKAPKIIYWTFSWWVFTATMLGVFIRRLFETHERFDMMSSCDGDFSNHFVFNTCFLVALSLAWWGFIFLQKQFLDKYYR